VGAVPEPYRLAAYAVATLGGDIRRSVLKPLLRSLGIEESKDVAAFTPGVHIGGSMAGQNSQFTIRGVSQNDYNDIVEPPNAVYVDEGYVALGQGQTFALYDVERVEVLKGPQGTLFGRNATGGLVHYITRKPNSKPRAISTSSTACSIPPRTPTRPRSKRPWVGR
jgi:outer membrane receptor protein involved in Fe transport